MPPNLLLRLGQLLLDFECDIYPTSGDLPHPQCWRRVTLVHQAGESFFHGKVMVSLVNAVVQ